MLINSDGGGGGDDDDDDDDDDNDDDDWYPHPRAGRAWELFLIQI